MFNDNVLFWAKDAHGVFFSSLRLVSFLQSAELEERTWEKEREKKNIWKKKFLAAGADGGDFLAGLKYCLQKQQLKCFKYNNSNWFMLG